MTTYYLDTSALGKRYVQEVGSAWTRTLTNPTAGHVLLTARITMVEIYSALARRRREGSVPEADCDTVARAFAAHATTEYEFVELDLHVVELSRDLLIRHPIRAYDAVQLASALLANRTLQTAQLPSLIFVSADRQLNAVAAAEGLDVDDPAVHS